MECVRVEVADRGRRIEGRCGCEKCSSIDRTRSRRKSGLVPKFRASFASRALASRRSQLSRTASRMDFRAPHPLVHPSHAGHPYYYPGTDFNRTLSKARPKLPTRLPSPRYLTPILVFDTRPTNVSRVARFARRSRVAVSRVHRIAVKDKIKASRDPRPVPRTPRDNCIGSMHAKCLK